MLCMHVLAFVLIGKAAIYLFVLIPLLFGYRGTAVCVWHVVCEDNISYYRYLSKTTHNFVLCCVVLSWLVLSYLVLFRDALCCVVLRCVVLRCDRCFVLRSVILCRDLLCCFVVWRVAWRCVMLCVFLC